MTDSASTEGAPTDASTEGFLLDVVGVGSPLVDVLATATEDEIAATGLVRGSMALVELAEAEKIYAAMGSTVEVSGGSAANTMAGLAALGGLAGFVGKIADDPLGDVFVHDIRASGVRYEPSVAEAGGGARGGGGAAGEGSLGTGRCLVLVSGDAERTMATHLGAATTISPDDVPTDLVASAQIVYLEGYLWDLPPAKEAMRRAIAVAHDHDGAVALSLSDPFCVERHQREFLDLLLDDVDVLFGNEEEIVRLFGASTFDDAVDAAAETGLLVAVTRGALGSVVSTARGPVAVPAFPVPAVVDTTGAGDLYAAGFLYGLTHGHDPVRCAELGALCAGEVIGHLGARPQADLAALAATAGLR
ncbi:MAG TPA: adenosine kinase [Acidimicrobiales bacterium]|nr:adenosine kinase [Acidimicrobiales bacterium]